MFRKISLDNGYLQEAFRNYFDPPQIIYNNFLSSSTS